MGRCAAAWLGVLAGLLAGCAHVTNVGLCDAPEAAGSCRYDPSYGYRFRPEKKPGRDTLVVVTLSGGGIRAAALGYGVLQAMQALPGVNGGGNLLQDVDIVSSVSGGSVTAAWYALHGPEGIGTPQGEAPKARFFHAFLREGGTNALAWRGLNPLALARYLFTPYQRSDVLAGYFTDRLFGPATYADVARRYRADPNQGFVILNATDLGHQTVLPFTQNRFDLLCSDLGRYRLADAVSASADFPLIFSPVGLRNFSGSCPAQRSPLWNKQGPKQWVDEYKDDPSPPEKYPPTSNKLVEIREARQAEEYIAPDPNDRYLHLVDGGVADNLGVQSTLLGLADQADKVPGLYQRLTPPPSEREAGYRNVRHVFYIVVNARTLDPTTIDARAYPPDLISSAFDTVDTSLSSTTLGTQAYLTAELEAIAACADNADYCNSHPAGKPVRPASGHRLDMQVVNVDFEMIPDRDCRRRYWALATSWSLPANTVENLIGMGQALLVGSANLQRFYQDKNLSLPGPRVNPAAFCPPSRPSGRPVLAAGKAELARN